MNQAQHRESTPPFSRPLFVDSVGEAGLRLDHVASESECAALAELNGLAAIRDLHVDADVARQGRDRLLVRGRVRAVVTQTCVVTLDPFDVDVDEAFEIEFAPEAEAEAAHTRAMAELEAAPGRAAATLAEQPDPPDPIIDGKIDLGALAAEFLVLGLDPYPHKPGVEFEPVIEDEPQPSPFAALAKLKKA